MNKWYTQKGPMSDVVMSTRIRIARNFEKFVFPGRLKEKDREQVFDIVKNVFKEQKDIDIFSLKDIPDDIKGSMIEKHIISPDFIKGNIQGRGLIVRNEGEMSIMVNEEDHLRMQFISPGFQLEETWRIAESVDKMIEKTEKYSFDNDIGYLTSCPTNVGTAIRASVMVHLPAFCMTKRINGLLEACSKMGIAVRGVYGENTKPIGNMFQISNQISLGQSELEIIDNVKKIVLQIIEQERKLRQELYSKNKLKLEDRIHRSYGILKNAVILSSEECSDLISNVRLGVEMGILNNIEIEKLNTISIITAPYTLQVEKNKKLNEIQRDVERANIIREKLE